MANATINALYAGSLRLNFFISFLNNCTFYKWCVTKVAHCNQRSHVISLSRLYSVLRLEYDQSQIAAIVKNQS